MHRLYKRVGIFFFLEHLAICVMAYMFRRNQVGMLSCPPFSLKAWLRVELQAALLKKDYLFSSGCRITTETHAQSMPTSNSAWRSTG